MLFTTPNAGGLEVVASDYNSRRLLAHSIFPPMHLNAFSTTNIVHFAMRSGFKVRSISTPGKLDVDMVCQNSDDILDDEALRALIQMDETEKAAVQHIIANLMASSHMKCVFAK